MAVKPKELRGMNPADRAKALTEARAELMHQRGLAAMGGAVKNPGKIRDLRTTIARILTVERELAGNGRAKAPAAPKPAAKAPAAKAAKAAPPKAPAGKPARAAKGKAPATKTGGTR